MLKRWIHTFALFELLEGMWLTLRMMFRAKPTIRYPEEKSPLSPRFRGMHALMVRDTGEEKCIGCKLCEAICPAKAIMIEIAPQSDGQRQTVRYEIDQSKCIFCGMCEQACPVGAIVQTQLFEYVADTKKDLLFTKEVLLSVGEQNSEKIHRAKAADAKYR